MNAGLVARAARTVAGERRVLGVDDGDAHEPIGTGCGRVDDVGVVVGVRTERLHEHRGVDAGRRR